MGDKIWDMEKHKSPLLFKEGSVELYQARPGVVMSSILHTPLRLPLLSSLVRLKIHFFAMSY